jgi:uncharacterized membrane protein
MALTDTTPHPLPAGASRNPRMTEVVHRNIDSLLQRRKEAEEESTRSEKIADAVTGFTGSMTFVVIHLVLFGTWISWNVGLLGLPEFDESFVVLAMFASVEAIFLSTFVLISQNRMNARADERADLDLQISLLTEHEVTTLAALVREIARKFDIAEAEQPEVEEVLSDVRPEEVMDAMHRHQQARDHEDRQPAESRAS